MGGFTKITPYLSLELLNRSKGENGTILLLIPILLIIKHILRFYLSINICLTILFYSKRKTIKLFYVIQNSLSSHKSALGGGTEFYSYKSYENVVEDINKILTSLGIIFHKYVDDPYTKRPKKIIKEEELECEDLEIAALSINKDYLSL
jgi:hypothetical protein